MPCRSVCGACGRSRYLLIVGTRVRDSTKEQIIANITASAIGTNRKRATPSRKNIGTKTMQMHSSETKAGVTIWRAPSRIDVSTSLPCSRCQLMFSIVTVASSTRMPTARARPPSVMMFSVWPKAASAMIEPSTDSGIDTAMITVERQLPRKSKIIRLVSAAAISPSTATAEIAARTKIDWSLIGTTLSASGQPALISSSLARMPSTMASVEALPFFSTDISTDRDPSTWTMLVWGALPSRTLATSRMVIVLPLTTLIGRLPRSAIAEAELFRSSEYSRLPIFWVPIGTIVFCAASALATSRPDRPRACIACGSRSIWT